MAEDASLDDFFAKKDRSKKKSKSKTKPIEVVNTDENNSNTAVTASATAPATETIPVIPQQPIKEKTKKKDKEKQQLGTARVEENDDDWIAFEDKSEKDYTGLRIQSLNISNRVEPEIESAPKESIDDDLGEGGRDEDEAPPGPWNKSGVTPSEPVPEKQAPVVKMPESTQSGEPKKYVPPGMRRNAAGLRTYADKKKNKGAPDLKNEDEFPTLNSAPATEWAVQEKSFEQVRSGGRRVENTTQDSLNILLENKYAALT